MDRSKEKIARAKIAERVLIKSARWNIEGFDGTGDGIAGGRIFFGYFNVSACLAVKVWL
jgi:hypothetical protein